MSILLPQPRGPQAVVPRLIDWGSVVRPPMGGNMQRLNRIGNRFALEVTYPRLRPEPDARILISRVRQALTEGAMFALPQPGLDIGAPGSPVVDGAGQKGSWITIRGMMASVREGQFFSIIYAGRRYLHQATADVSGSQRLRIPIAPMLRVSPNDGAVCEFAQPIIEGFIDQEAGAIEYTVMKGQIPALTITEAA